MNLGTWLPKRYGKHVPASELMAQALEQTGGSLNPKVDGVVTRLSGTPDPWDISKPWHGREITGYTVRKTLWDRTALVRFYVDMTSTSAKLPIFSLKLALPLTDEEISNAADTYMMLLNTRRVE